MEKRNIPIFVETFKSTTESGVKQVADLVIHKLMQSPENTFGPSIQTFLMNAVTNLPSLEIAKLTKHINSVKNETLKKDKLSEKEKITKPKSKPTKVRGRLGFVRNDDYFDDYFDDYYDVDPDELQ